MKIAFITPEYPPYVLGGCGLSADIDVRVLRQYGLDVDVFVFHQHHEMKQVNHGITRYYDVIQKTPTRLILKTIQKLRGNLSKYDLIEVIGVTQIPALKILQLIDNHKPIIAILNGTEGACYNYENYVTKKCKKCTMFASFLCVANSWKKRGRIIRTPLNYSIFKISQFLSRRVDKFFVLSEPLMEMYISAGYPENKMTLVPNMLDPEFVANAENATREFKDEIIILYVGRLEEEKGIKNLIQAFSQLKRKYDAKLWIVGTGSEQEELKKMAVKFHIEDSVKFFGTLEYNTLPKVYKNADIFVHPGLWPEPFARTTIEAMVSGLPIVCSDVGATPSIVGSTGLTYRRGNVNDLVKKLEILLTDDRLRKNLGEKARKKAMSTYSPEVVVSKVLKEYRALVE